jgi:Ca2+-binding RTX toxin-like protein
VIRLLERRRLLDALLSDHLLTVTGTSQADMIRLQIVNPRLVVYVNSQRSSFPLQSVKRINVVGGSGNDRIELSEISKPATMNAGAGNDSVFGGQSADLLLVALGAITLTVAQATIGSTEAPAQTSCLAAAVLTRQITPAERPA